MDKIQKKHAQFDFVIIGGGVAGATAAETLRIEGSKASILILSNEKHLPYQRAILSKKYIASKQDISTTPVLTQKEYEKLDIHIEFDRHVTHIDCARKVIRISNHADIEFKKLLIATGASPMQLEVPGVGLEGVHYLRTIDDALAIKQNSNHSKRVVIVGGSYLALEIAASLSKLGLHVTMLTRDGLLDKLDSPDISHFFESFYKKHHIEIIFDDEPIALLGSKRVKRVKTKGNRDIDCDMVVIAIGVTPNIDFLRGSGIQTDDGILVDKHLKTNKPNIFAAGDVANFYDPIFNIRQRVEHWDNAVRQGRVAAQNMLGNKKPFDEVPYFYSHVFNLSFNLLGLIEPNQVRITRGSMEEGSFACFYVSKDVIQALFTFGRPSEELKVVENLIKHQVNISAIRDKLSDPHFSLNEIPNQTIYILQGGGALGSFECGAIQALSEKNITPDIVAGVSIGAFNGAIIAGNPNDPAKALLSFWGEIMSNPPPAANEQMRHILANEQAAMFGVNNFFQPRWLTPPMNLSQMPMNWSSFYDFSPVKSLLEKYVDFDKLHLSPIRLLISAVNIQTGEMTIFDSHSEKITVDHIIASGSLPPMFPWTTINGKHYWDGGILSNSPLETVVERCGSAGKQIYVIDLFPGKRSNLPQSLPEVMARRDEIQFSERIRSDLKTSKLIVEFKKLVNDMAAELPDDVLEQMYHEPRYIQMMGEETPMKIIRITRETTPDETTSGAYDFSEKSIQKLIKSGYEMAKKAIRQSN